VSAARLAFLVLLVICGCASTPAPQPLPQPTKPASVTATAARIEETVVRGCSINAPGGSLPCLYRYALVLSVTNSGGAGQYRVQALLRFTGLNGGTQPLEIPSEPIGANASTERRYSVDTAERQVWRGEFTLETFDGSKWNTTGTINAER
jgi:hypothetical protein